MKLNKKAWYYIGENKTNIKVAQDTHIEPDSGMFFIKIDKQIEDLIDRGGLEETFKYQASVRHTRVNGEDEIHIVAPTLAKIEEVCKAVSKVYFEGKVENKYVILFEVAGNVRYYRNIDGTITNGPKQNAYESESDWQKRAKMLKEAQANSPLHPALPLGDQVGGIFSNGSHNAITTGFKVRVMKYVTTFSPAHPEGHTKLFAANHKDYDELGPEAKELIPWVTGDPDPVKATEIPYTPEAALFFSNMIKQIIEINEKLLIFKDKDIIGGFIENASTKLLS